MPGSIRTLTPAQADALRARVWRDRLWYGLLAARTRKLAYGLDDDTHRAMVAALKAADRLDVLLGALGPAGCGGAKETAGEARDWLGEGI